MIGLQTHQVAGRPVNDGTAHLAVSIRELLLPVKQLQSHRLVALALWFVHELEQDPPTYFALQARQCLLAKTCDFMLFLT